MKQGSRRLSRGKGIHFEGDSDCIDLIAKTITGKGIEGRAVLEVRGVPKTDTIEMDPQSPPTTLGQVSVRMLRDTSKNLGRTTQIFASRLLRNIQV